MTRSRGLFKFCKAFLIEDKTGWDALPPCGLHAETLKAFYLADITWVGVN